MLRKSIYALSESLESTMEWVAGKEKNTHDRIVAEKVYII